MLEIISTIMLNFIAIHLVSYLVRGPLQESTHVYPQTESITASARLPVLFPGTRLHAGFLLGIVLAATLGWFLKSTAAGSESALPVLLLSQPKALARLMSGEHRS